MISHCIRLTLTTHVLPQLILIYILLFEYVNASANYNNNIRFCACVILGVIRWCLMCAVQCAQDCHVPASGEKEKKSTSSSTLSYRTDRSHSANDIEKKVERLTRDSWQMSIYTSDNIINEEDTPDRYLSSVCAALKCAALSEILKKDLEMIGNVILYTLSSEEKYSKMRLSSTKKAENYGKPIDNAMSSSGGRVFGGVGGVDGLGSAVEMTARLRKLSSTAMLRVYLLRLLFVMYEEHISTVIGTGAATVFRRSKADSNAESNQVSYFHFYLWNSILLSLFIVIKYCIVLYCIVLHIVILHCIESYHIVLYYIVLYCIVLHIV